MCRLPMALTVTTIILCAGLMAWKAEAMVGAGATQLRTVVETAGPVSPAACRGGGAHCPPGYVWNGNRCVAC
jgi:hypothetical protein